MAVYQFRGTVPNREDRAESGTVVASSEEDALAKLQPLKLQSIRLRKLTGLGGLLRRFTADIK